MSYNTPLLLEKMYVFCVALHKAHLIIALTPFKVL